MKRFFTFMVLALALAQGAMAQTDPDSLYAKDLLKPGTVAPKIMFNFHNSSMAAPLEAFKGMYVVLDFWASWCPDCRKDIPAMKKLYETYASKGVKFIGISFDTDPQALDNCVKKYGIEWLQYSEFKKWKKETKTDRDYKVNWIPTIYLINPEGKVELATVVIEKLEKHLAEATAKK